MPQSPVLNKIEKIIIFKLKQQNKTKKSIAKFIKWSKSLISSFLKNTINYSWNHRGGKQKVLSEQDKWGTVYLVTINKMSASEVRFTMNLNITVRTVQCTLQQTLYVKHLKVMHLGSNLCGNWIYIQKICTIYSNFTHKVQNLRVKCVQLA